MLRPDLCMPPPQHRIIRTRDFTDFSRVVIEEKKRMREMEVNDLRAAGKSPYAVFNRETKELTAQVKKDVDAKFLEEKRRQKLRTNEDSLRTLECQLRYAASIKKLLEQKAEHEEIELEKHRKKCEDKVKLDKFCQQLADEQLEQERQERQRKVEYRETLYEQIKDKGKAGVEQLRQKEEARILMDEFVRRFEEDQRNELLEKQKRKRMLELEHQEFKRMQAELRRRAETQKQNEEEELAKLQQAQEDRRLQQELNKQRKIHEREMRSRIIGAEIYAKEKAKRDHEDEMLDLLVGERGAREDAKFERMAAARIEARKQLRDDLNHDRILLPIYRQKLIDEREQKHLEEWKESLVVYDKYDEKAKAERLEKILKLSKEHYLIGQSKVSTLLDKKRAKERQAELDKEAGRAHVEEVERERMAILKQQSPSVLRYMPPDVLTDADCKELGLPPPWELRRR